MSAETTQPCPNCAATLPVVHPYITWCHQCGWNIVAPPAPLPSGRFDRLYELAGRKAGDVGWGMGDLRLAEYVTNAFLWLLSRPPLMLFYLEVTLLLQDSRRAEYLADAIAAATAGSDAVIATHEKLLLESSFEQVVRQYAHPSTHAGSDELFAAIRSQLAAVPERERERRRRVAMLAASSLGATHPPTGHRIRVLEERPIHAAKVVLTTGESDAIDRELARLRPSLGRRLIENQRARLYRR